VKRKVIYIKRLNKRKVLKSIFRLLTIPLALNIIIDILNIKEIIGDGWIKILGLDKGSGIYYLLNEYINLEKGKELFLWLVFIAAMVIIIIHAIFFFLENRQERLLIIEHNSLNQTRYRYDDEVKNEYDIKRLKFNQYETFNSNMPLEAMIIKSITETDLNVDKIKGFIAREYAIGYAGIANIPITFMLGFELGDENAKRFFHKYHGKGTNPELKDDKFHLLKAKTVRSSFELEVLQELIDPERESNIIIVVSLTQPIEKSDFSSIAGSNDYIYKYTSSDDIDYDVVDSETQIEQYADKILSDIAIIQKKKNVKQIRLCIAASGAFIFGLGTKFSKTQNIETVVYHFEKKQYPWGINVTKKTPVINLN